jgi:Tol biopolymer transport system component
LATGAALVLIAGGIGYLLRPGELAYQTTGAPIEGTLTRVTSQPGREYFPSLSPDGEFIVYASDDSGNWDIFFQRVDGETALNLTENSAADDTQPALSPAGKRIAFRSERDGGGIFLMGATGESVRRLTDFGFNPAWSPDGKEIAFVTEETVGVGGRYYKSQLWAVNVTSAETRLITEGDAVHPSWSPHGHRIAYWESMRTGRRDILTLPANGGETVPVTDDVHVDWNPVWSPDGKHLYFSSDRGGSMNLWRVPIEEESGEVLAPPEPVTTGASAIRMHLALSKDGMRLAYVERVDSSSIWKAPFEVSNGTLEGDPIQAIESSRFLDWADVSPDGQWLAFQSYDPEEIFVMRMDGTSRRQLTDDVYMDRQPSWSPDGKRIAFYSNRSGSFEIWTIRPDGSGLLQLTETSYHLGNPAWSPDGQRLSCFDYPGQTSYLIDPGKSCDEQTPLQLPPLSDDGAYFHAWSWSPDGQWIAGIGRAGPGSPGEIVIYSPESRHYRRLRQSGVSPIWLPDSRRLLFITSGVLHLIDIESEKTQEVLSLLPYHVGFPEISSDGRSLYFTRLAREADIWLLTLNE